MAGFIIFLLVLLVFVIIYQIGKSSELASIIRGEEYDEPDHKRRQKDERR